MTETFLVTLLSPDTYIWLMALLLAVVSLFVVWLCWRYRNCWLRLFLVALLLTMWYVLFYGTFVGVRRLVVRHVEFASADLPSSFDGYRIVQFSDAHLATFSGWRQPLFHQFVDSINAQKADMIVFTGDLQNKTYEDIQPFRRELMRLKAKDGVTAVLGNHDYPMYTEGTDMAKTLRLEHTIRQVDSLEWQLLLNQRRSIRRDSDRIYIAGMENDGEGHFPQLGNITSCLYGLDRSSFVIMLEHDPTSWRRKILPHSHAQLTLSGHTHGGHFSLLGLSPVALRYRDYAGMYYVGDRAMIVSTGLSGVVPFRFGVPPEIVVITLRCKRSREL